MCTYTIPANIVTASYRDLDDNLTTCHKLINMQVLTESIHNNVSHYQSNAIKPNDSIKDNWKTISCVQLQDYSILIAPY